MMPISSSRPSILTPSGSGARPTRKGSVAFRLRLSRSVAVAKQLRRYACRSGAVTTRPGRQVQALGNTGLGVPLWAWVRRVLRQDAHARRGRVSPSPAPRFHSVEGGQVRPRSQEASFPGRFGAFGRPEERFEAAPNRLQSSAVSSRSRFADRAPATFSIQAAPLGWAAMNGHKSAQVVKLGG